MLVVLVLVIGSAVTGVKRVQEVESRLQIDAVRVFGGGDVYHLLTSLQRLTGYAQEGTLHQ